ncbi:type 1 glutamine amidotransferase [Kribbia dieselivorans]|uniref:type 1 glutamine amidotransferase n=1 Tax=Kribbia dieselivorans TaxID=331526 RepID=UPI0009FAD1E5|nr:cobalamin biosynthesis protein CobB [Kribbia dieselivorans]
MTTAETHDPRDLQIFGEPERSDQPARPGHEGKGVINIVHLYPREMSIYGDLGNTRCLAARIRRHGYAPVVRQHHPGDEIAADTHLVVGGGGQDSGQVRIGEDLAANADRLRGLADDGVPMLMVCGMYQLFGRHFVTVGGATVPGLGIFDLETLGGATRMIGPVVLDTEFGQIVGYENHSGATQLASGARPLGRVQHGHGNNGQDRGEGAIAGHVIGTYLHGPVLPANPRVADALIGWAAQAATGRPFEPEAIDDTTADRARQTQISRLLG